MPKLSKDGFPAKPSTDGRFQKAYRRDGDKKIWKSPKDISQAKAKRLWEHARPYLLVGAKVPPLGVEVAPGYQPGYDGSLQWLLELWLDDFEEQVTNGEKSAETFAEYKVLSRRLCKHFGKLRDPDSLSHDDFDRYRDSLYVNQQTGERTNLATTVSHLMGVTRDFFRWSERAGLLKPMGDSRFGVKFRPPPAKAIAKAKQQRKNKGFTAEEVRKLLDAADGFEPIPHCRAVILFCVNSGSTPTDIRWLEWSDISGQWFSGLRQKTGVDRKCWLWDETRAALKKIKGRDGQVFRRPNGEPWTSIDPTTLGKQFRRLQERAGVYRKLRGIGQMRHTFGKATEELTGFLHARQMSLGQAPKTILEEHYSREALEEHLRHVSEHVRKFVFGDA